MEGNEKINMWLMSHSSYFSPEHMAVVQEELAKLPENKANVLLSLQLKNPTTMLIIAIFLGSLGVDRFMLGDVGLGVAKLLTSGGCGIWTIIDAVTTLPRVREKNFQELMLALGLNK